MNHNLGSEELSVVFLFAQYDANSKLAGLVLQLLPFSITRLQVKLEKRRMKK